MKFYQEITLIDSSEINFFKLWSKLYTQVHLALVEQAKTAHGENATHGDIGVSFPEYKRFEKNGQMLVVLGSKLRIFANTEQELNRLDINKWCERLLDYIHIKSIKPVPNCAKHHVCVKRVRQIKNNDRLTRSYAKKHGMSFDLAKKERIERFAQTRGISFEESEKHYNNPSLKTTAYIQIESLHDQKRAFSLEFEQVEMPEQSIGQFNTYGLSSTSTVPNWVNP